MTEEQQVHTGGGISRRDIMKRSAVVGGAMVWATPLVQTMARPAFAQVGTPETNGDLCPEGDQSGQPSDLTWEYTGEGCAGSDHSQDEGQGDVFCQDHPGYPNNEENRVEVVVHGGPDAGDHTFQLAPGETFMLEGKAGAKQSFEVWDNGTLLHEAGLHTSCSQPLEIGDQIGSFKLVGGTL